MPSDWNSFEMQVGVIVTVEKPSIRDEEVINDANNTSDNLVFRKLLVSQMIFLQFNYVFCEMRSLDLDSLVVLISVDQDILILRRTIG